MSTCTAAFPTCLHHFECGLWIHTTRWYFSFLVTSLCSLLPTWMTVFAQYGQTLVDVVKFTPASFSCGFGTLLSFSWCQTVNTKHWTNCTESVFKHLHMYAYTLLHKNAEVHKHTWRFVSLLNTFLLTWTHIQPPHIHTHLNNSRNIKNMIFLFAVLLRLSRWGSYLKLHI